MKAKAINFVIFQLGWLLVVLLGASTYHWLGLLVVAAIVGYHLLQSPQAPQELRLIGYALALGLAWENLLTMSGVVVYRYGQTGMFAPLWILAMWAMLATTLNVSLRWMHGKPLLAALFGVIGGPLAFVAGYKLGAVTFPDFSMALLVLSIGWGLLFMLLVWLAGRNDGFSEVFADQRMLT